MNWLMIYLTVLKILSAIIFGRMFMLWKRCYMLEKKRKQYDTGYNSFVYRLPKQYFEIWRFRQALWDRSKSPYLNPIVLLNKENLPLPTSEKSSTKRKLNFPKVWNIIQIIKGRYNEF